MDYYDHWTANDFKRLGEQIRSERERERQNEADQARITAQYCPMCGMRLRDGKCDSQGCAQVALSEAEIYAQNELVTQVHFNGGDYGTFPESQVSDMRHPTW